MVCPGSAQALCHRLGHLQPLFPPAGSPQVQVGPEEDRDHLYHPVVEAEAEAEEPADLGKPLVLSTEVQNGPEKDRDHLYHG